MVILEFLLVFLVELLVSAAFLWVGMKVASIYAGMRDGAQYCSYFDLLKVCVVVAVVSIVPYIGWIAAWVALFYMLSKVTEAEVLEIIIMVLVSRLASLLIVPFIFAI